MKKSLTVSFIVLFLGSVSVYADKHYNNAAIGKPGIPANVTRTIEIEAYENRFSPSEISVTEGDTIRFIVRNTGKKKHEMMIDTMKHLRDHHKMMRLHDHGEHDEPNQITLKPGEQKELIWQFTRSGVIDFACPLPGHFKGMRGKITVEKK
jgi:uncharacterized cupredoxin-like copper-binding protein